MALYCIFPVYWVYEYDWLSARLTGVANEMRCGNRHAVCIAQTGVGYLLKGQTCDIQLYPSIVVADTTDLRQRRAD